MLIAAMSFGATSLMTGLVAAPPVAQTNAEIRVNEPRPLAAALLRLESQLGIAITYEDPPYVFARDVVVSDQGPLIPRPGTIEFSYALQADAGETIRRLLDVNAKQANPGAFELLRSDGFYHVIATAYANEQGSPVRLSPILSSRVTIAAREVTGLGIIELVAEQLSSKLKETKETFVMGTVPAPALSKSHETFTCSGVPARDCLREVLVKSGYNFSWQLFYDPKLKWYVFNVHPVGYSG